MLKRRWLIDVRSVESSHLSRGYAQYEMPDWRSSMPDVLIEVIRGTIGPIKSAVQVPLEPFNVAGARALIAACQVINDAAGLARTNLQSWLSMGAEARMLAEVAGETEEVSTEILSVLRLVEEWWNRTPAFQGRAEGFEQLALARQTVETLHREVSVVLKKIARLRPPSISQEELATLAGATPERFRRYQVTEPPGVRGDKED
jgi:hypothetical protein